MERIFNIYIYFQNDLCSELGYVAYEHEGDDSSGIKRLRNSVEIDFPLAKKLKIKQSFTREEFNARARLGEAFLLFEELFFIIDAGPAPLCISTPVKDGQIHFNHSSGMEPLNMSVVQEKLGALGLMDDWLVKYTNEHGIDVSQLIHDDYFVAIKLTYNAGLYVSAMKLLLSCIDSLAYIDFGDIRKPPSFISWLDAYVDLSEVGITAAELWELRNGMLHMSNVNSDRVRNNKVRRISFCVGQLSEFQQQGASNGDVHYFEFLALIHAFAEGQAKWIATYNEDREKFYSFVERYDQVVSDSRMAFAHISAV